MKKSHIYKRFIGLEPQILKETPDHILVGGDIHSWFDKTATPFMILSDDNDNSVLIYTDAPISHKRILEIIFNTLMYYKADLASLIKKDILKEYGLGVVINKPTELPHIKYGEVGEMISDYSRNIYDERFIFGRLWKISDNRVYISIWEDPKNAKPYKSLFIDMLNTLDIAPASTLWEIRNSKQHNDFDEHLLSSKFFTMDEFFDSDTEQKPTIKKPHEVAGLGKALGVETPGFGSYKQGEIASKLKMPFVKYHAMVNQESLEM